MAAGSGHDGALGLASPSGSAGLPRSHATVMVQALDEPSVAAWTSVDRLGLRC
jgi:hypothetical protein